MVECMHPLKKHEGRSTQSSRHQISSYPRDDQFVAVDNVRISILRLPVTRGRATSTRSC